MLCFAIALLAKPAAFVELRTKMIRKFQRPRLLGWAILAAAVHGVGQSFTTHHMQSVQRVQITGLHQSANPKAEKVMPQLFQTPRTWQKHNLKMSGWSIGHAIDFRWSLSCGVLLWSLGTYIVFAALLKWCVQCQLGVQQCLHLSKMSHGSWIF